MISDPNCLRDVVAPQIIAAVAGFNAAYPDSAGHEKRITVSCRHRLQVIPRW